MDNSADRPKQSESVGIDVSQKGDRAKKVSRVLVSIILITFGVYHFVSHYYSGLDGRLFLPSKNGIKALIYYELGQYKDASHAWRAHYGLSYDPALVENLKKSLAEKIIEDPGNSENYHRLADLSMSTGNYTDACATYQAALKKNRYDYDANLGLAACLAMQGEYKRSQAAFADLFKQRYAEKNITSFLNLLVTLDTLERSKSLGNADVYLTLAFAYRYLRIIDPRKEQEVIHCADKALSIDGRLDEAFFCKGVMYLKQGQYAAALEQFSRVVAINPSNADAYNRMGYIYGVWGDLEKELACYKKSVEIEKNDPVFAYNLGDLLQKKYGDTGQANRYFKKAHELNPADYNAISMYGYTSLLLKNYNETLIISDFMIRENPDQPYGYKLKADCFLDMKRYEDALKLYFRSQEVSRNSGESSSLDFNAFIDIAIAYTKLKKLDEAITAYEYALKIRPHDVDTLFFLQSQYRRKGRYEDAYRVVKEILRIQPDHSGAQRVLPYLQQNVAGEKTR